MPCHSAFEVYMKRIVWLAGLFVRLDRPVKICDLFRMSSCGVVCVGYMLVYDAETILVVGFQSFGFGLGVCLHGLAVSSLLQQAVSQFDTFLQSVILPLPAGDGKEQDDGYVYAFLHFKNEGYSA